MAPLLIGIGRQSSDGDALMAGIQLGLGVPFRTPDEVRYVTEMARRIAALVGMQAELDGNYRAVIAETHPWGTSVTGAGQAGGQA